MRRGAVDLNPLMVRVGVGILPPCDQRRRAPTGNQVGVNRPLPPAAGLGPECSFNDGND
jgi:hypothetical protein